MVRARVLLCVVQDLIAEGLRRLLDPHYVVVGVVADARLLLPVALSIQPDLIAADLGLPELCAKDFEILQQIRQSLPPIKLLGLVGEVGGMAPTSLIAVQIAKSSSKTEILAAIEKALAQPRMAPVGQVNPASELAILTPRQQAILRMIAEGKSSKEMAYALNISLKTVEFHRSNLRSQLGVRSTAELTRLAVQAGF